VEGGGASCGNGGQDMAVTKPWARARQRPPLSEGTQHGLGTFVRTGSPTVGSRTVFDISILSQTGSTLKF
jgi:hypothetical protein